MVPMRTAPHFETEEEVWEFLALAFSTPRSEREGYFLQRGLCYALNAIDFRDVWHVRRKIENTIEEAIRHREVTSGNDDDPEPVYGWRLNDEGDRSRVAFCRIQLELARSDRERAVSEKKGL